jgi:hypothetical protein
MRQNRNYGQEHLDHMRRDQIIGLVLGTVLTATGAYTTAYVSQKGLPILLLGLACIALINSLNRD